MLTLAAEAENGTLAAIIIADTVPLMIFFIFEFTSITPLFFSPGQNSAKGGKKP
jgi:hypothetical protein